MKKFLFALVLVFALSTLVGCGAKEEPAEVNYVIGTFLEKKDFMFTVLDSEGTYYGFNFDVKPKNYGELNDGDIVKVTYTGTISEVDPFDGEIISIEKGKR